MTEATERLRTALADRYEIERRVGEGGMALVYLAEDLKHHRRVALKILPPELAAALGAERFLREIQIAARLVREGQLPVDEAVKLAARVAGALAHAHSLGIVHRDIKPENILLSGGEPVVADFGIAKAVSEAGQTQLTESGFAVGTAPYMSPEQASGQAQVGGRSDIYALGCVLYEMLAGAPPFTGPTLHAITARKLTEPVPPLRTVRETVPAALEQIVFKALARLPADRYATGMQLAEALEVARTSATTPSAPVPAATMMPSPWRARLPWGVAAAAVVVASVAGVMAWRSRSSAGEARLSVTTPHGTEVYGFSTPLALSPDGRALVFAAGHNDSVRLYLRRLDNFDAHALPGTEGGDSPFFSPDGRGVVFNWAAGQRAGTLLLATAPADGSGGPVRLPTDTLNHQQPFTWAAGGRELLYTDGPGPGGDFGLWVAPLAGGGTAHPLMHTAANETQPAVSPDGRWLAWMTDASGRYQVMVRRYPDGPDVPVSREGGREPAWSPDGREIYFRDLAGTSMMVASFAPGNPPQAGTPRILFTGQYSPCFIWCRSYDVSPDGRRFVMTKPPQGFTATGYWPGGDEIRIVPHWDRELRERMRTSKR